ncbi:MAG: Maf family protein [Lachnospiraceae bacterium]
MEIILASASPRRKELLEQIGMEFTVIPAKGEEHITKKEPEEVVMELSLQKAEEVAKRVSREAFVIGADTVVAYQGKILGKPKDEEDAYKMLQELSGNIHEVYTGVTLIDNKRNKVHTFYEKTSVAMYSIEDEEIRSYIATKEPMDKAGAYAIQGIGAKFIKRIEGDYCNVVGLPIGRLYQEIRGKHIEI